MFAISSFQRQPRWRVLLINGLLFQLTWFVCVGLGNHPGFILVVGLSLLVHFLLLKFYLTASAQLIRFEWLWIVFVTAFGWVLEWLLFSAGLLVTEGESKSGLGGIPYWLIAIWPVFATTFRFCFSFLVTHLWLAPICGFFACMSYAGGAQISSSVDLGDGYWLTVIQIGVFWSVAMALLCAAFKFTQTQVLGLSWKEVGGSNA